MSKGVNEPTLRAADIVLCLDVTGAMAPIVEELAAYAPKMHQALAERTLAAGAKLCGLRVKLVLFKDYKCDVEPITETRFFSLPDEVGELAAELSSVRCGGGGDFPEGALEGLCVAMRSDFAPSEPAIPIITLISDATAHPLGTDYGEFCDYPAYMPKSRDELRAIWQEGAAFSDGYRIKGLPNLIIYMPSECKSGGSVGVQTLRELERSYAVEVKPGCGCADVSGDDLVGIWSEIITKGCRYAT